MSEQKTSEIKLPELLRCPFDGAIPLTETWESMGAEPDYTTVTCSVDGCVLGNMAVNPVAWNRRTALNNHSRLVEALEHYANRINWSREYGVKRGEGPRVVYAPIGDYDFEFGGTIAAKALAKATLESAKG